jgi:anti-sigma regulatory factor (Ser/Thr protein kinase)
MNSYRRAIYRIEARTDSPARARHIIEDELARMLSRERLDEVKLLVSELVTNGVRYGGVGEPLTIDVQVNGNIRCAVIDHGPGPAAREEFTGRGGWGLKLVERLARRWGIVRSPEATQIWFETAPA